MDLGNWYWQKEDPNTTFEELKNQISIFHLKNIDFKDGKPETVMLEDGKIEWMDMIGQLDDDVKVFLEYPIMEDEIANQINTVKKAK